MPVTLSEFLKGLFSEGRVRVARFARISGQELEAAEGVLVQFERAYRQELWASHPTLCVPAARWAALAFYRVCQFVAFREAGQDVIDRTLSEPCPQGDPPSVHYSVDLTFRYLPSLAKLAESAAPRDPLLAHLARWAVEWPLSSVGMPLAAPVSIDPWAMDPCLLGLYVDRVIASGDVARVDDARVGEAVRRALGPFPDLAPKVAAVVVDRGPPQDLALEGTL